MRLFKSLTCAATAVALSAAPAFAAPAAPAGANAASALSLSPRMRTGSAKGRSKAVSASIIGAVLLVAGAGAIVAITSGQDADSN